MDAHMLFRKGVFAIHNDHDIETGRELLTQSLTIDPENDMAWLWLTRTVSDPQKRLAYIERALSINPDNTQAQALKARLLTARPASPPPKTTPDEPPPESPPPVAKPAAKVIRPLGPQPGKAPLPEEEVKRIDARLAQAERYLAVDDEEAAIAQWVAILKIQVDHEEAMRQAVGHLWRLNYADDAKELIWRALKSGTTSPSITLTALDIAEREGNYEEIERLRKHIAELPDASDTLLIKIADSYVQEYKLPQAVEYLRYALEHHPDSQLILIQIGDLNLEMDRKDVAMHYYEQAVSVDPHSKAGKDADKKLSAFVPVLNDRERGSVWLAVREAAGVGLFFLLMGWQDAGLNLLHMGIGHWLGVLLALAGGYLLVTATSSPQQIPLAKWLGGQPPKHKPAPPPTPGSYAFVMDDDIPNNNHSTLPIIPSATRYFLGMVGIGLLLLAFVLVFDQSLDLVLHYTPPSLPEF